jgi:hypothetical protein
VIVLSEVHSDTEGFLASYMFIRIYSTDHVLIADMREKVDATVKPRGTHGSMSVASACVDLLDSLPEEYEHLEAVLPQDTGYMILPDDFPLVGFLAACTRGNCNIRSECAMFKVYCSDQGEGGAVYCTALVKHTDICIESRDIRGLFPITKPEPLAWPEFWAGQQVSLWNCVFHWDAQQECLVFRADHHPRVEVPASDDAIVYDLGDTRWLVKYKPTEGITVLSLRSLLFGGSP